MRASGAIYGLSTRREGIDTAKARDRWRQNWTRQAVWGGLCLALIALEACRLAATSTKTGDAFRPDDLLDGIASFDSFSEPSVACAILRQEAERLQLVYREHQDQEVTSQARLARLGVEPAARPGTGQTSDPLMPSGNQAGWQASSIQSLNALDAQVQDLERSLSRTLLMVYAHQHLWNEFVDRYLQLVREGPAREEVVVYFRCALDCSLKCGRTEEVVDLLRHIVRFHPELNTAERLNSALAEWKAEISQDFEVGKH